jgi:vacuolar-type H+-ATPase subunit H
MASVPNENILKLRKLTEKLNSEMFDGDYKIIVKKLKKIVDDGRKEINKIDSEETKIKCYEAMCSDITTLLTNTKI